jgi:hypothetical protein
MRKAALVLILVLAGCRCASRDDLLRQLRDNLANDIGPKYRAYIDADPRLDERAKDIRYGVVENSIEAIDMVLPPETAPVESAR